MAVLENEMEKYAARKAKGRHIGAGTRAYIENQKRKEIEYRKTWDVSFGCYCIVMGTMNALMENYFVESSRVVMPANGMRKKLEAMTPRKKNQDKKAYRKAINKLLREGIVKDGKQITPAFPYYNEKTSQAVNGFKADHFEKWANRLLTGAKSLLQEMTDTAIEYTRSQLTVLRYSVKNEMDKMNLPDTGIRSLVYTLYLVAQATEQIHLGFMLVGPCPEWQGLTAENDTFDLLQRMEKVTKIGESEHFNKQWYNIMNEALAYWNVRYCEQLKEQVCGAWTHKEGGDVTVALQAVKRKACSGKYMEKMTYDAMMNDGNYEEELKELYQLECYSSGEVAATLIHLEAVRMYREGKSNEDIERWLTRDKSIVITKERQIQILTTVEILRRMKSGEIKAEAFNAGMKEAHDRPDTPLELEEPVEIPNFIDALAEGFKEKEKAEAEQARLEAIANDPVNRLREKFGNVTEQKEKKPKQHPQYFHPKFKVNSMKVEAKKEEEPAPLQLEPTPPSPRRNNVRWTPDEENYLQKSWGKVSIDEIQKHLWRTEASIRSKASRMIKKPKSNDPQLNFE